MNVDPLITRHRPRTFDDVVGHAAVVRALRKLTKSGDSRAYLFTGPAGVGKTTLARLTAAAVGCDESDLLEIPAAVYTGIDAMREALNGLQYMPFGAGTAKAVILDEAHRLSKQSWDALLKAIEEPPSHVYWMLCTTQVDKVPHTIRTRCANLSLKPVSQVDLEALVERVLIAERLSLPESVFTLIIKEAAGSPRQALANLALCSQAPDRKTAADLLNAALPTDATIALCRLLVKGGGAWTDTMALVDKLDGGAEGVRHVICSYVGKALRGAKSDKDATYLLGILDQFSTPYPDDDMAHLLVSIGRVMYA